MAAVRSPALHPERSAPVSGPGLRHPPDPAPDSRPTSGTTTAPQNEETDEVTDETTAAQEPAYDPLPDFTPFEGRDVKGIITTFKGSTESFLRETHLGEWNYVVGRIRNVGVAHKDNKDGLKRAEAQAVELVIIRDVERGRELVAAERQAAFKRGELVGQREIDDELAESAEVTVDESGVALTPDEVAEARSLSVVRGAPWPDYDRQQSRTIIGKLDLVETSDELHAVIAYERTVKKRTPIIEAAEARLAELQGEEE